MIGYVSTWGAKVHKNYMEGAFASHVGSENVITVKSSHNDLPENAYNIDSNENGISDMFEFALSYEEDIEEEMQSTE